MISSSVGYTTRKGLRTGTTSVTIQLSLNETIKTESKAGVLFFRVTNENGANLPLSKDYVVSNKYGTYSYVNTVNNQKQYSITFTVPPESTLVEVGFDIWSKELSPEFEIDVFEFDENTHTDFSKVSIEHPVEINEIRTYYTLNAFHQYKLRWEIAAGSSGQGLLLFNFYDDEGEALLPSSDFAIHPKLGSYSYASSEIAESVSFVPPRGATGLIVEGKHWKGPAVKLTARPTLVNQGPTLGIERQVLTNWLGSLSDQDNLLIIHSTAGPMSKENTLLLRSNRMALEMSMRGWKVIYVPFSTPQPVDKLVNDNLIQASGSELVASVDKLVGLSRSGKKVFICSSHSDMVALSLQNRLQDNGWKTVYEIRDDMEEFRRVGYSKWYRPALELRFASEADALIATSPRLRDKISVLTGRDDVRYLPNAAPDDLIDDTRHMRSLSHAENNRGRPIVGYLGHLTSSWFDWQKFLCLVKNNPTVQFEIIGHGLPTNIKMPMNVRYLGAMNHKECLPFVERWKVGLIPFIESRLTYGVDPNKVYEYVAMGLQTVSSPMGDLGSVPGVHLYRTNQEFQSALESAVCYEPDDEFFDSCNSFVQTNSWKYRVSEIASFIEGSFE